MVNALFFVDFTRRTRYNYTRDNNNPERQHMPDRTPRTVKLVHRDRNARNGSPFAGVAGEQRVPFESRNGQPAEVECAADWFPQPRSGIARQWEAVSYDTASGATRYRARR